MTDDPLYQPLRRAGAEPLPRRSRGLLWGGLVVMAVVAGAGAVLVRGRGEKAPSDVAVARIETAPAPQPKMPPAKMPPDPAPTGSTTATPTPQSSAPSGETVEIQNGVKVIRLGVATSSASIAIPVPSPGDLKLKPAPDPRLIETTSFGALPRMGPNGVRAAEIYARPVEGRPAGAAPAPRIALVAGGMGLNQLTTAEAARRWPLPVTFAFPPNGPDLQAQVAETRAAGHEVILQLSDERGAPAASVSGGDDPGLGRLHQSMARFTGYAGVAVPGVGRSEVQPAVRDIERRGLYLVDAAPPEPAGLPAPQTDVRSVDAIIPQKPDRDLLTRLVERARSRGSAIGWIAGSGADPDVASLAAGLQSRGIELVPLSALADTARLTSQSAASNGSPAVKGDGVRTFLP